MKKKSISAYLALGSAAVFCDSCDKDMDGQNQRQYVWGDSHNGQGARAERGSTKDSQQS